MHFKGVVTTNYDPGIVDARMRVRPGAAASGSRPGTINSAWTVGGPDKCSAMSSCQCCTHTGNITGPTCGAGNGRVPAVTAVTEANGLGKRDGQKVGALGVHARPNASTLESFLVTGSRGRLCGDPAPPDRL